MTIRTYLSIVCVLLVLSVGAGVYVWYVYQTVEQNKTTSLGKGASSTLPTEATGESDTKSDTRDGDAELKEEQTSDTIPPVTLTADMLSEKQRAVLNAFGMGDMRVTVTETLILCIRGSIEDARFEEILGGSAPSPREALAIAACVKKE